MANKAVMDIELNDDEFVAFQRRFHDFQAEVSKVSEVWKKAPGMSAQGSSASAGFQAVFDHAKANTSTQAIANQNMRVQVGAWNSAGKSAKQFGASIYQATQSLARWSGLTSLFGSILAGGGLYGISRMASSAMSLRSSASGLGVSPAELQASQTAFGRLGDMEGVLSGFSNALHDITKRRPLVSLFGKDYESRTKGKNAAEVFKDALPDIKRLVDRLDPRTLNQAIGPSGYDLTDLGITPEMARIIRNMKPEEIESMRKSYGELKKAFKIDDQVLRTWTELVAKIHRAGEQIEVAFLHDFSPLVPVLKDTLEWSVTAFKFMMKFGVSAVEGLIQARDLIMDAFDLNEAKGWLNDILPSDPSMFVERGGKSGGGGGAGRTNFGHRGGGAKSFDGAINDAQKGAAKSADGGAAGGGPKRIAPSTTREPGTLSGPEGTPADAAPHNFGKAIDQLKKGDKRAAPTSKDALPYAAPEEPSSPTNPFSVRAATDYEKMHRPAFMKGDVAVGGEKFKFGSGGIPGFPSIPYGDYPVTPNEIGAWGKAHGAIGINHGSIWDPMSGRERGGIELHAGHTDELITHGCMAIAGKDWPAFKQKVMAMIKENGRVYLHVGPDGKASVTPSPSIGPRKDFAGAGHGGVKGQGRAHLGGRSVDNTKNDSRPSVKVTVNDYAGGSASVQKIIQRGAVQ